MSDELPEVLQAEWSSDQLMQLFADLAAGAEVEHVQLRTDTIDASVRLSEARVAFVGGSARAIQIRYRYENELWCDTIIPSDPTTKIVRTRLPEATAGSW